MLAGCLALVGGYVNSAGFVLLGVFTSHVTGSIGRGADDFVQRDFPAAFSALLLVFTFLLGSFTASTMLQTSFFRSRPAGYAVALFTEALLLALFVLLDERFASSDGPRLADAKAGVLCLAMGMQNSLVTVISDARVRTTHLTGVVTDLGIELARWFRWYRGQLSHRLRVPLVAGAAPPEKPSGMHAALLLVISVSFIVGALTGAETAVLFRSQALLAPSLGCFIACVYALKAQRSVEKGNG